MQLTGSCLCGALKWNFDAPLESVTACNCTACRRYGVLWAYDYEGEGIKTNGEHSAFFRNRKVLGFHFCGTCGCVGFWRSTSLDKDGRRRIAVNVRLVDEPKQIEGLLIDHFDGLDKFDDLPRDGRCVRDMWF